MSAFKGCTNPECKAFKNKKYKYKDENQYCTLCGQELSYVCADCWKAMQDDTEKYCISCKALREQKKEKVIDAGKGVVGVMATAAMAINNVGNGANQVVRNGGRIVEGGKKLVQIVGKIK